MRYKYYKGGSSKNNNQSQNNYSLGGSYNPMYALGGDGRPVTSDNIKSYDAPVIPNLIFNTPEEAESYFMKNGMGEIDIMTDDLGYRCLGSACDANSTLGIPSWRSIIANNKIDLTKYSVPGDPSPATLDSWEFHKAMRDNKLGNKIYDKGDALPNKPLPLGSMVGMGDARTKYISKSNSLLPRHSATVVGWTKAGNTLVYDLGEIKVLPKSSYTEPHPIYQVSTITAPNNAITFDDAKTPRIPHPGLDIDSYINKLPIKVSDNYKEELYNFSNTIRSKQDAIKKQLGLSDTGFDELYKMAIAISTQEHGTTGSVIATIDNMFGNSTGITQIQDDNRKNIKAKYPTLFKDSNSKEEDALITMALLKDNLKQGERLYNKGKTPGTINETIDVGNTNVKRIINKAADNYLLPSILKVARPTKGNASDLTIDELSAYMWNNPSRLATGDAQGAKENQYVRAVMEYRKLLDNNQIVANKKAYGGTINNNTINNNMKRKYYGGGFSGQSEIDRLNKQFDANRNVSAGVQAGYAGIGDIAGSLIGVPGLGQATKAMSGLQNQMYDEYGMIKGDNRLERGANTIGAFMLNPMSFWSREGQKAISGYGREDAERLQELNKQKAIQGTMTDFSDTYRDFNTVPYAAFGGNMNDIFEVEGKEVMMTNGGVPVQQDNGNAQKLASNVYQFKGNNHSKGGVDVVMDGANKGQGEGYIFSNRINYGGKKVSDIAKRLGDVKGKAEKNNDVFSKQMVTLVDDKLNKLKQINEEGKQYMEQQDAMKAYNGMMEEMYGCGGKKKYKCGGKKKEYARGGDGYEQYTIKDPNAYYEDANLFSDEIYGTDDQRNLGAIPEGIVGALNSGAYYDADTYENKINPWNIYKTNTIPTSQSVTTPVVQPPIATPQQPLSIFGNRSPFAKYTDPNYNAYKEENLNRNKGRNILDDKTLQGDTGTGDTKVGGLEGAMTDPYNIGMMLSTIKPLYNSFLGFRGPDDVDYDRVKKVSPMRVKGIDMSQQIEDAQKGASGVMAGTRNLSPYMRSVIGAGVNENLGSTIGRAREQEQNYNAGMYNQMRPAYEQMRLGVDAQNAQIQRLEQESRINERDAARQAMQQGLDTTGMQQNLRDRRLEAMQNKYMDNWLQTSNWTVGPDGKPVFKNSIPSTNDFGALSYYDQMYGNNNGSVTNSYRTWRKPSSQFQLNPIFNL